MTKYIDNTTTIKVKSLKESEFYYIPTIEDGKVYTFKLSSHVSFQYAGYFSILKDLQGLYKVLERIDKESEEQFPEEIYKPLYCHVIAVYARCFKDATKGRRIKLEKIWLSELDEKLKMHHDNLINLRDQYVGHAGISDHEEISVYLFIPIDESKSYFTYGCLRKEVQFRDDSFILHTKELLSHLINKIESKLKTIETVLNKEIVQVPISERRKQGKLESQTVLIAPSPEKDIYMIPFAIPSAE